MATTEQIIEGIRAGAGERSESSEVEVALYRTIKELKEMISFMQEQINEVSAKTEMALTLQEPFNRLRAASALVAAKVDATATPVTSALSLFNNNI